MSDFKDLEILVAKIQKQLSPGATVTHNAKIMGRKTEVLRQIDVLVEQNIGQYKMSVVIETSRTTQSQSTSKASRNFTVSLMMLARRKG